MSATYIIKLKTGGNGDVGRDNVAIGELVVLQLWRNNQLTGRER